MTLAGIPPDQAESALAAAARGFQADRTSNFTTVSSPQPSGTIAGAPAIEEQFTFVYLSPDQHVVNMRGAAFIITRGLTTYVVVYAAQDSQLGAVKQQYFAPMLAALQLDA
jgi:hypothetical protein